MENIKVENCLILFEGATKDLKWINFYKIVEIIESCPQKKIDSDERNLIKKLKRTSQSHELIGIMSSRHGHSKDEGIKQFIPITLIEAEKLVRDLLISWINNILENQRRDT